MFALEASITKQTISQLIATIRIDPLTLLVRKAARMGAVAMRHLSLAETYRDIFSEDRLVGMAATIAFLLFVFLHMLSIPICPVQNHPCPMLSTTMQGALAMNRN